MERREVLKIAASLGAVGVAGRFVTACTNPIIGPPLPTTTTTTDPDATTTTTLPPTTVPPPSGYGPLGVANADGLRLPSGFTSRIVATTGLAVASTGYVWHTNPDGGDCFATSDGGWVYVSNAESAPASGGGASMVRFAPDGTIVEARRILSNTTRNCAGGATPWGTWLSCEETLSGRVHECYPLEVRAAEVRPALGVFNHEAVTVHVGTQTLYLTEDQGDGGLYRFRPTTYPSLSAGTLEVMTEADGTIGWAPVPDPSGATVATRKQVATMKVFKGGEGLCVSNGIVFFTTKGDNRVWAYNPFGDFLVVIYDLATSSTPILSGVDNITASTNGELFVAEDGGDMQIVQLFDTTVAAVAQVEGAAGSEITGPAFSPDGTRLYFSSQRSPGVTYEVTGPWHRA